MLTDFEQVRQISGWDPTITSTSRAYPDGEWRERHVRKEMEKVLRKARISGRHAEPIAQRLCQYLKIHVDQTREYFASSDLLYWREKLKKYAVAETDKARESGFIA